MPYFSYWTAHKDFWPVDGNKRTVEVFGVCTASVKVAGRTWDRRQARGRWKLVKWAYDTGWILAMPSYASLEKYTELTWNFGHLWCHDKMNGEVADKWAQRPAQLQEKGFPVSPLDWGGTGHTTWCHTMGPVALRLWHSHPHDPAEFHQITWFDLSAALVLLAHLCDAFFICLNKASLVTAK